MKSNFLLLILVIVFQIPSFGQKYIARTHISEDGTLPYRILLPEGFRESKKYPVLLFLHGAGERGNDNLKQLVHGSSVFANSATIEREQAIVVFPQCPQESYWSNAQVDRSTKPVTFTFSSGGEPTIAMKMVLSLMDSLSRKPYADNSRIYVGGLSMGGMGTYEILSRKPEMFAAAFAICGGGSPDLVKKYRKNVPLWIFHGAKDDVVDPKHSVEMLLALQNAGHEIRFNLYPESNHNSWDKALGEPDLLNWLFSKILDNEITLTK